MIFCYRIKSFDHSDCHQHKITVFNLEVFEGNVDDLENLLLRINNVTELLDPCDLESELNKEQKRISSNNQELKKFKKKLKVFL